MFSIARVLVQTIIQQMITKCRQAYYGLSPAGMLYPGAASDVQSYLKNKERTER